MTQQRFVRRSSTLAKHRQSTVGDWFIELVDNPDLQATAAFCIIGLLITLNLMLFFPNLGALVTQYNQF
jgi:hypothetical protein